MHCLTVIITKTWSSKQVKSDNTLLVMKPCDRVLQSTPFLYCHLIMHIEAVLASLVVQLQWYHVTNGKLNENFDKN